MSQNATDPAQEIRRLQRCMSDLVSVLALPAILNNSEPSQILETFLDALINLVDLDFLYAQARVASHEEPIEVLKTFESNGLTRDEIRQALHPWFGEDRTDNLPAMRRLKGDREISILPLQLGIEGNLGFIAAGSQRLDFPQQTERLVISVAVNQVAVLLQRAQLLSEQRHVARELDERVAQRTAELAAANQELRREIVERQEVEERLRESEVLLKKSEAKLWQVIDTIPTLSWCNLPDGSNEFLSKGWHEYTGLPPEEAHGWGWQVAFHSDDLSPLMKRWQEVLISGEPGEIESRLRRSDGVYRWFLIRMEPFRDETGTIVRWYGTSTDIHDRKLAEEAVLASERNLSLIINTMPVLAWSAQPDGSVDFFNQRWLNYTGLSPAQAQGWGWAQAFHPDDLGRLTDYWQSIIATGESGKIEARLQQFDGSYRWFLFWASPLRDESGSIIKWYGTNTDIDDRKHAEEAVQERELNLREITETIPEMLWSATPDGAVDYCNGRLLNYSGLLAEEVMHYGWTRLLHPDDVDSAVEAWKSSIQTGNPYRVEVRTFHAADQTYRWCVTSALPLLDKGERIVRWHGTVVDMHDWKKAQEEIRNTQEELAKMMRATTLGQLTASIAHEINQPLSGIITNANTCLRMLDSDSPNIDGARETARRTLRDGNRASEVITRLRTLFNKKEVVMEAVDLNEAAREVIALSLSELQNRGVILRHALASTLPVVKGDRIQLQQVILNLLRNASDAMSSVENRQKRLVVTTEQDGENVRLTVKDSGIGFEAAACDRLFESFYTTKREGMGIGLSVSRSIIEAHCGRMWATANDGPGATFAFSIPCENIDHSNEGVDR